MRRCLLVFGGVAAALVGVVAAPPAEPRADAAFHHWLGVEFHLQRRLDDAALGYARALALDPPRDATLEEEQLVRRFLPRLQTNAAEPFALKDVAVVLHPERRVIAYHLFWEDDIDFPDDNDPCDHEVVWVGYAADGRQVERIWTYFHGRVLAGGEPALREAREHGGRPRIDVQWGKHGSMPVGWQALALDNEEAYRTLHEHRRRVGEDARAQRAGWPRRFGGTWNDFVSFSRAVDPRGLLSQHRMIKVSRWNSATIQQHFLRYNFRPKIEWPPDGVDGPTVGPRAGATVEGVSPAAFNLPPKRVFEDAMPRYPNLWFYVDPSLATSYEAAVRLVTGALRETMALRESFGPFGNPEGCDFEAGLEHLQPWTAPDQRALQHAHAFHIRYYYTALQDQGLHRIRVLTAAGPREFYRFAASVHYEVEHNNPNHADVEACPICGRTGAFANEAGNLVERVHDPLGLEFALAGTIRGERVRLPDHDGREQLGVAALTNQFAVGTLALPAVAADQNTQRLGVVVITQPTGR
jgi:hypothetical protein